MEAGRRRPRRRARVARVAAGAARCPGPRNQGRIARSRQSRDLARRVRTLAMKFALINPPWSYEGSIYFGCREPHLPLEYGYAKALLEADGHDVEIFDGQLGAMTREAIRSAVAGYAPDVAVVTTAPRYLFRRCAPPELRAPQEIVRDPRPLVPAVGAVGAPPSPTPGARPP